VLIARLIAGGTGARHAELCWNLFVKGESALVRYEFVAGFGRLSGN
jgi:hypothetical protein